MVVGVSNSPANLARSIVLNLIEFGFGGPLYIVGPREDVFLGHKIHLNIADIPQADLAVILIPARNVPDVLRQCGEKGIKRVVLQSAGFRELAEDKIILENEVLDILRYYGMRMIGPNCIGVINRRTGLVVPFIPMDGELPTGGVSVVSQSGGVGRAMIDIFPEENIGLCKLASMGNKLDVDEVDLLAYLIRDNDTEIIFCHLEDIRRGRALFEVACGASKPIIVQKCNCGNMAAVVAHSHSAALSGDDRVVDAAMRQCGILRSREHRETINMIKAFSFPPMRGNRLAVISRSAGHGVMAADAAEEYGFILPAYPEELIGMLERKARAGVTQFHNPLDMGDLFDMGLYGAIAEDALVGDHIDGVVIDFHYQSKPKSIEIEEARKTVDSLIALSTRYKKPLVLCLPLSLEEIQYHKKRSRYPIFTDAREAIRALAWNRDRTMKRPLALSNIRPDGIDIATARSAFDNTAVGPIPPESLAAILSAYGIPLVDWGKAESAAGAVEIAHHLGFPVALKTADPNTIHKSEAGGVILNLRSDAALRDGYAHLAKSSHAVLVQQMAEPGLEWLVGGRQDGSFGPVLVAALGGIYVEIIKETATRVAPIGRAEAERMVEEIRGAAALLSGVRGQPPLDRQSLVDMMVRISWLLDDFPKIGELDLNPVRVFPNGCLVLDWKGIKTE
jgi:acetate---CoA ligase (ADP-forming)